MSEKPTQKQAPPAHRGRLQAQGPVTEQSEPWAQDEPPTKSEMLERLEKLWAKLSGREQKEFEVCFEKAKKYIEQAPQQGIEAPVSSTFRNKKLRKVRVDLEIRTGSVCMDDPG